MLRLAVVKRRLFNVATCLSLLLAASGCSASPTMTFRVIDAATNKPLHDVLMTHSRSRTVTRWTPPLTTTTKSAPVDAVMLRPEGTDAHVTVSVDLALDHYVTFAADGYFQVRVQVERSVGGEEPTRIFVEPVSFDPRQPYFAPPADVIVIPLNRMPPRDQRHMWLK
jgi:hypothetical protein